VCVRKSPSGDQRGSSDKKGERMDLEQASIYHRNIILLVLVYLIAFFGLSRFFPLLAQAVIVATWVANIYYGYKLAAALGKQRWLWAALGAVGPLIMWIPHLLLLNSANKAFKREGMKIGFLGGARKAQQ
jgi:hypothetical protein